MSGTEVNGEGEKALAEVKEVEKKSGITAEQQLQVFQECINYSNNMNNRVGAVLEEREKTKRHLADAKNADKDSRDNFKLANRQLDILEKVLTAHFAERKSDIEKGFSLIDKALEEGNWDKVAQIYGDMSAMVAKSPLAAAVELNTKMKSGKAITLDDF